LIEEEEEDEEEEDEEEEARVWLKAGKEGRKKRRRGPC
jgi:hypothetical protein